MAAALVVAAALLALGPAWIAGRADRDARIDRGLDRTCRAIAATVLSRLGG